MAVTLFGIRVEIVAPELQAILDGRLAAIAEEFHALNRWLRQMSGPPRPLGSLTFTAIREEENMLLYNIGIPTVPQTPEAFDVVGGRLTLTINGEAQPAVETNRDQTSVDGVRIPQDATVAAEFVLVDDAGNTSAPVIADQFVAKDNFAPPAPEGGLSFVPAGEVPDEA